MQPTLFIDATLAGKIEGTLVTFQWKTKKPESSDVSAWSFMRIEEGWFWAMHSRERDAT